MNVVVNYRIHDKGIAASQSIQASAIDDGRTFTVASDDFRTAAAAAMLAMILRDSPFKGGSSLDQIVAIVRPLVPDPSNPRAALLDLITSTKAVARQ